MAIVQVDAFNTSYDKNVWRYRLNDGFAVYFEHKAVHTLCAWRETLINEYKERVRLTKLLKPDEHFIKGYEPGTRSLRHHGFSDSRSEFYEGKKSIIDIRHSKNLTASKWKPEDFKSQRSCRNWKESSDGVQGWDLALVLSKRNK